jgi:DNA-binding CsgD family transcriptional regulator
MAPSLRISHLNNSTEDAQAPYLRAVTTPTRDQIRERINQFTSIPSAARAVLIEVCTLVELGGKGRCFASNKLLAERACCAEMTVSKHLQSLFKSGLLSKTYLNNDHSKRDLIPSNDLIAAYRTEGGLSGVLNGVKWGTERGLSRVRKGVKRGAYQIENTKEGNKEELLSSRVAELQSALDAATAAHQKKEAESAAEIEKLNLRIENSILKFKTQETELAGLRSQSLAIVQAKPVKPPRQKSPLHAFAESPYALVASVETALAGTDYEHADIPYYHEVIHNWAVSKGERRADWLGTIRNAIIKDSKEGKLKLNPNSQLIPTEHDKQQQSARAQQLGLYDPAKRQAARELLSAYRAGQ